MHWSVAVITRGPLRVRGKRSSVCPSIKKGIPKERERASRQIDGERAGEAGECEREGGEGQSKRKTMLLPVTAGHSGKIREQRCEPAYVHADHEKRTDATRQTVDVHQRTFPSPNRPPSVPADFKFPARKYRFREK